ncbi:MAG: hypothetical protein M3Q47_06465 [Actinomycetota bacterium]|nr:hypothetical protein [Actinomycetota bacterium]
MDATKRVLRSARHVSKVLRERLPAPASPTGPDGVPRRAYLIGTNFSGSSVFGQALGAHPGARYLGEMDRLVWFAPTVFADEPDPTCHYCELHGQPCPVWHPDRVRALREVPHGKVMDWLETELGSGVLVDGSKHPAWLRAVMADEPTDPERTVAFITARSPFAFAASYRRSHGCQIWEAANVWRDVYYDGVRMVETLGIPSMVVRYEHFARAPEPVLRPACTLLGLDYRSDMLFFQDRPRHDVGGNYGTLTAARQRMGQNAPTESGNPLLDAWLKHGSSSQATAGQPFGGWVDDKWQLTMSVDDVEQILQTPGLVDVANRLGYRLGTEVAAWERRQTAPS